MPIAKKEEMQYLDYKMKIEQLAIRQKKHLIIQTKLIRIITTLQQQDSSSMIFNLIINFIIASFLVHEVQTNGDVFNWTVRFYLSNSITEVEFSPDQTYLAMAESGQSMYLMDGVAVFPFTTLHYDNPYLFSAMAFSQDSSMLAIGFESATESPVLQIYRVDSLTKPICRYQPTENTITKIKSVCFTKNKQLISITSEGHIYSYSAERNKTTSYNIGQQANISSVACSPQQNGQFIVSASNSQGTNTILKLFHVDKDNGIIQEIYQFQVHGQKGIYGVTYASDGFYWCGNDAVYFTKMDTKQAAKIDMPAQLAQFRKIRVSTVGDIRILAVSTASKKVYIQKTKPGQKTLWQIEQNTTSTSFGLSQYGTNLLTLSTMSVLSNRCLPARYLDLADDTCKMCTKGCRYCLNSSQNCFGCLQSFYLQNRTCLNCVERCKQCTNATYCYECLPPFTPKNNGLICGCFDGMFVHGDQCQLCNQQCRTCENLDKCTGCRVGSFLQLGVCKKCGDNCQECEALDKCHKCSDDYLVKNGICEQKEEDGLPKWGLIILVILGVSVVIAITSLIMLKIRKANKLKQSQLLGSDQQIKIDN